MSWFWSDVNNGRRLKIIDLIPAKFNYCTKSQKRSTSFYYSPLCDVKWGRKLADVCQLISHVISLGSKPNSIYFNTETNGGLVSLCLDRGRNEDDKYLVYVQPGSIYLVIGAKTSSVRNIIVISLLPEKFPYGRLHLFRLGKKFQGFISRGPPIDRLIFGIFLLIGIGWLCCKLGRLIYRRICKQHLQMRLVLQADCLSTGTTDNPVMSPSTC